MYVASMPESPHLGKPWLSVPYSVQIIHSFIHLFYKHLLRSYYVLGGLLDTSKTAMKKIIIVLALRSLLSGKTDHC